MEKRVEKEKQGRQSSSTPFSHTDWSFWDHCSLTSKSLPLSTPGWLLLRVVLALSSLKASVAPLWQDFLPVLHLALHSPCHIYYHVILSLWAFLSGRVAAEKTNIILISTGAVPCPEKVRMALVTSTYWATHHILAVQLGRKITSLKSHAQARRGGARL